MEKNIKKNENGKERWMRWRPLLDEQKEKVVGECDGQTGEVKKKVAIVHGKELVVVELLAQ